MTRLKNRFAWFVCGSVVLHAVVLLSEPDDLLEPAAPAARAVRMSLVALPEPRPRPVEPTPPPPATPAEALAPPIPAPGSEASLQELLQAAGPVEFAAPKLAATTAAEAVFASQEHAPVDVPTHDPLAGLRQRDDLERYLARLHARLMQTSLYPHYVQVLGISGTVSMSFQVDEDGRVTRLDFAPGQHDLLIEAARDILEAAQPLPTPPTSLGTRARIQLPLQFTLDD